MNRYIMMFCFKNLYRRVIDLYVIKIFFVCKLYIIDIRIMLYIDSGRKYRLFNFWFIIWIFLFCVKVSF